jgi:hypothetical protein
MDLNGVEAVCTDDNFSRCDTQLSLIYMQVEVGSVVSIFKRACGI